MTALLTRASDALLQRFVPRTTASAWDRCSCNCYECCVYYNGAYRAGSKCYDCINGYRCGCKLNGRYCL